MSRKQDDFVFLWQTRLCDTRSFDPHPLLRWNCVEPSYLPKPCCHTANTENIAVVGKTPMVATSITSRSVIRSESCSTTFQRTHGCRCSSTHAISLKSSAILGYHLEISTWSDQCFSGSAGDVWRLLFRQHGRFEESVRRHRVFVHCPSLRAAMNARRHVFVTSDSSTSVKTTLPMPSEPVPTLKMAIGSQLIRSAESHCGGRSGPCTD